MSTTVFGLLVDFIFELVFRQSLPKARKHKKKAERCFVYVLLATCAVLVVIWATVVWKELSGFRTMCKIFGISSAAALALAIGHETKKHTRRARLCTLLGATAAVLAVISVFGDSPEHTLGFLLSYWMTFSLTVRMSKCFEDVYEKYRRMRYFLHMTPWSTLKRKYKVNSHGLLPEFGLATVTNIETWNKMRVFLERYDIKWDRERQISGIFSHKTCLFVPIQSEFTC